MEKKEELLERLVNEIAAQNKRIALQIAKSMGIENFHFLNEDEQLNRINKKANSILKIVHS